MFENIKYSNMFKSLYLYSIIIFLLFLSSATYGQELKIYDAETLEPIENVAVYTPDKKKSAISNVNGFVSLDNFDLSDTLNIQHATYKPIVRTKRQLEKLGYSIALDKRTIQLQQFVISAYRWEQNIEEIPNKITTIPAEEVQLKNPQTAADLLSASNQVYVQKSQLGGGSPMIRGFATNSVLLVVDGVRMNNAIYRSGNLQNVISLDAHSIENSEIIFGPGSVTYGSDALGGVMDFHTKSVKLSTSPEANFELNAMTRYSTANNEKTAHLDLNVGKQNWGFLTSMTYSDYDHLEMGSNDHPDYRRMEYVDRINGTDSIVTNDNPDEQIPTGYNQVNFMQKIRYRPTSNLNLSYAYHFSQTSDIPRYDRLIQRRNGSLKNAQWYYGPQRWQMHHLSGLYSDPGVAFDNMKFSMAYQYYEESRHDRGYKEQWLRHRTEKLDIGSFNLDFDKSFGDDLLYYGVQYVYNSLNSKASSEHIQTGNKVAEQTRYPNGDNVYQTLAAYISYKKNFSEKYSMITGLRYSYFDIYSTLDTAAAYYNFPFNEMTLNTGAFNGSLGFVYHPTKEWKLNINGSSGFHAPNIDDMAKVFDSEPASVVMPNENLRPEYAYNVDLGVSKSFEDKASFRVTGFYTWVKDKMVRRKATFNGKDSIMYDGVLSQVHKLVNAENARIYGFNAALKVRLPFHTWLESDFTWTEGEDSEGVPLRHVAPPFGQVAIKYDHGPLKLLFNVELNGEISNEELAPSEQSKTHMYALNSQGDPYSPSWWTFNFKASYEISETLSMSAGVENILDVRYRPYSSGIVAPGRNFIVALRAHF